MRKLRIPFFSVNPKSYVWGDKVVEIAKHADMLAEKYDIDVMFTAQLIDIPRIKQQTKNLIMCAQHMDGIVPGRGMGHVLPEALVAAGVEGVVLNHAEKQLTLSELVRAMKRAKELDMITSICVDTVEECRAAATLKPAIMICEETSRIATGVTSDMSYMVETRDAVKEVSPETIVVQGAGIKSYDDVYRSIMAGSGGSGGTSGIVAAEDPCKVMDEMVKAVVRAREELKENGSL